MPPLLNTKRKRLLLNFGRTTYWNYIFFHREYCPEHDRLLKLQAEARTKDKDRQKKKFQHDFENDVQAQSVSSATSEILLRNRAIGGESSSDDEEHEGRPGDDDGIHEYFVNS